MNSNCCVGLLKPPITSGERCGASFQHNYCRRNELKDPIAWNKALSFSFKLSRLFVCTCPLPLRLSHQTGGAQSGPPRASTHSQTQTVHQWLDRLQTCDLSSWNSEGKVING